MSKDRDPLEKELSEWFAKEIGKAKSDPNKYIREHEAALSKAHRL